MSHLTGQAHSAGSDRAAQLLAPHELTIGANSAPGLDPATHPALKPLDVLPAVKATGATPARHRAPKPDGNSTNTGNAAIIPDPDPWLRRRRRRLGPGR